MSRGLQSAPRSISPTLAAATMAAAWAVADTAVASDRALQAVLDRLGCNPARVMPKELSKAITLYEVTCRGSGRIVQVACLESECRLQVAPRDDEEER